MAGFQKVYEQYSKSVYRFLLSLTGEEGMAEELLQETFYQAFLHIDQFEGRSSLYTWLCQIGKNTWLKECRRNKRFADDSWEELKLSSREPPPDIQIIQKEEYRRMRQAVLKLDEPYKDVFILHAYGGLKLKEIALSYGKTESWARVTYYRAKQQIERLYQEVQDVLSWEPGDYEAHWDSEAEAMEHYQFNQDYYRKAVGMTLEEFTAYVQAYHVKELQDLAAQGISFKRVGYRESYYSQVNGGWNITYGIEVTNHSGEDSVLLGLDFRDGRIGSMVHREVDWYDTMADVCEVLFMGFPDGRELYDEGN